MDTLDRIFSIVLHAIQTDNLIISALPRNWKLDNELYEELMMLNDERSTVDSPFQVYSSTMNIVDVLLV